jgi:hypothetical protein
MESEDRSMKAEHFFELAKQLYKINEKVKAHQKYLQCYPDNEEAKISLMDVEEEYNEQCKELPFLNDDEFQKAEVWLQQEIVDLGICPFCHGKIVTNAINDRLYTVECQECASIFYEE